MLQQPSFYFILIKDTQMLGVYIFQNILLCLV